MKRKTHLLIIIIFFVVLLAMSCSATSSTTVLTVVQVFHERAWTTAQMFCREHYSDLVTIRNQSEANRLALFEGWIGLRYVMSHVPPWLWSEGNENAKFFSWDSGEPTEDKWCAFKRKSSTKWSSDHCSAQRSFLCVDERMILVQEMKTWEEAVLHCRELQGVAPPAVKSSHPYHLASLPEVKHIVWDRETIERAASQEVWIGLRFLAGEWVWLSGDKVTSSYLPNCPSQQQYCGALDPRDQQWKTMDCSQRKNFLCNIPQ